MNYIRKHIINQLTEELLNTDFCGEEDAILTHFENAGTLFPFISEGLKNTLGKPICSSQEEKYSFIDLFAGLGGFRLSLENCGGKCKFSSEWDKSAKEYYKKNHKEVPFGDITKFTSKKINDNQLDDLIPDHDILAGGFPCQPFSRAGVSARNSLGLPHGFECTTQGTLFYSIERIASQKMPKILFLENVWNLVSHDKGRTFKVIKETVKKIGYQFFYAIINSETVVPQRRKRCFMVCVRNDIYNEFGGFVFPTFNGTSLPLKSILDPVVDDSYTISDKLWAGHQKRSKRNKERGTGFTTREASLNKPSNTIVARYGKDGKECLIPQKDMNPRKLTINECRKLFGYPKDFELPTHKTPAYKLLGNSVVVPVVQRIANKIINQYFPN